MHRISAFAAFGDFISPKITSLFPLEITPLVKILN